MAQQKSKLRRNIGILYIVALHCVVIAFLFEKLINGNYFYPSATIVNVPQPGNLNSIPPADVNIPAPQVGQSQLPTPQAPEAVPTPTGTLAIPVQGVLANQLIDTFEQARGESRVHNAIDIPAPPGTPVLAAADGEIVRFHDSEAGGITIYQISSDQRFFYYYAHLQARSTSIAETQTVSRGTVIGYVGDTGNAGPGNYHLHFAITVVTDPKRFWEGTSINPYPILTGAAQLP